MKTTNVLLVLSLLLLTGCFEKKSKLQFKELKKPKVEERLPQEEERRTENRTIAEGSPEFEKLKKAVLEPSKCIQCHAGVAKEENLLKWVVPGKPEESKLFKVVESGMMPKKPYDVLTTSQLEDVRNYISKLTPKRPATYAELEKKILTPMKCLQCHKSVTDEKTLIEKWITPGELKTSKLFLRTADGTMPKNGNALSREELNLVIEYVKSINTFKLEAPPERAIRFTDLKSEILEPMGCFGCHPGKATEEGLAKWIDPAGPAASKLLLRVSDGSMPMGGPALTSEQLKFVEDYITAYLKK